MPNSNTSTTTQSDVKTYETWAAGSYEIKREIETDNIWRCPSTNTHLDASCHAHRDGTHSFDLRVSQWVSLEGSIGDSIYSSFDLLNGTFTLDELKMISKLLKTYVKGIETGAISAGY